MSIERNKVLIRQLQKEMGNITINSIFVPVVIFKNVKGESVITVSYEFINEIFNDYLEIL